MRPKTKPDFLALVINNPVLKPPQDTPKAPGEEMSNKGACFWDVEAQTTGTWNVLILQSSHAPCAVQGIGGESVPCSEGSREQLPSSPIAAITIGPNSHSQSFPSCSHHRGETAGDPDMADKPVNL